MSSFYFDNAIAWAQIRMRGGWKSLLLSALGYLGVVVMFIGLMYEMGRNQNDRMEALEISSMLLLILQTLMLLSFGGMAVSASIRRDLAGKQIESHRLMPLGSVQAVFGYITGASSRISLFSLVNLLVGMVLFSMRGLPVSLWLQSNIILALFGLMLWSAMAMAAFVSRGAFWIVLGIAISIPFSAGRILILMPGLLILGSPVQGGSVFAMSAAAAAVSKVPNILVVSVAAQLIVSIVCIRAAARKYVREDAVALPMAASLAMLALWVALSWIGINYFSQAQPRWNHFGDDLDGTWQMMVVGSVASALIISLLSLAGVAWQAIERQHRRDAGELLPGHRYDLALCLVLCLVMVSAILVATPREAEYTTIYPRGAAFPQPRIVITVHHFIQMSHQVGGIVAACAIFLGQIYLLMRMLYSRFRWANIAIGLVVGLVWFVPLVVDGIYSQFTNPQQSPPMDFFTLASPLGTIYWEIDSPFHRAWPGLVAQFVLLLFLATIFGLTQLRVNRRIRNGLAREVIISADAPPIPLPVAIIAPIPE